MSWYKIAQYKNFEDFSYNFIKALSFEIDKHPGFTYSEPHKTHDAIMISFSENILNNDYNLGIRTEGNIYKLFIDRNHNSGYLLAKVGDIRRDNVVDIIANIFDVIDRDINNGGTTNIGNVEPPDDYNDDLL